jgi:hypothetical protein
MADLLAQQVIEPTQFGPGPTPAGAPLVQGLQAFLAARAGRKADEAEEGVAAAQARAGEQIAGRLTGGAPVREVAPPDASGLGEVKVESQYRASPEDAFRLALTPAGGSAMKGNPMLAAMLAQQMDKPKKQLQVGAINLADLTPESAAKFAVSNDPRDIEYRAPETKRDRLVAVLKDGTPTYVGESEAEGMTPANAQTIKVSTGGGAAAPAGNDFLTPQEVEAAGFAPGTVVRRRDNVVAQKPPTAANMPATIVTQVAQERKNTKQLQQALDRTQSFISMIEKGELPLNKASRFEYGAKRMLDTQLEREGDPTQPYVRYYELERFVNQQVNRILNLAKGPQTDQDALRARQQILDNPDNQKVVLSALKDLERIWKDEVELSNASVQDLTSPYAGQSAVAPAAPAAPKKTKRRTASGIEYEVEE